MEQLNKQFRGKIDNRYTVVAHLGDGGMGFVFKAIEDGLERVVALKMLHENLLADAESISRFHRESKMLSSLAHKNVLTFYRFGVWNEIYPYIAMEYFDGRTLKSIVSDAPMEWMRALKIVVQVVDAMDYLHASGVVHRDLTSNNVMVADLPEPDTVKLLDFGLAKLLNPDAGEQRLTKTGILIGSVSYMSPEQASGKIADNRSDIYSFGCIAYEMLTGQLPFNADNPIGLMHKHVHEIAPSFKRVLPSHSIPEEMEKIVMKCLEKNPDKRFQSAKELMQELSRVDAKGQSKNKSGKLSSRKIMAQLCLLTVAVALCAYLIVRTFDSSKKSDIHKIENALESKSSQNPQEMISLLEHALNSMQHSKVNTLFAARVMSRLAVLENTQADEQKARTWAEKALVSLASIARSKRYLRSADNETQFAVAVSDAVDVLVRTSSSKHKSQTQLMLDLDELRALFEQKRADDLAVQLSLCQLSIILKSRRSPGAVQPIIEHLDRDLLVFEQTNSKAALTALDTKTRYALKLLKKSDLSDIEKNLLARCLMRLVEKWIIAGCPENAEQLLDQIEASSRFDVQNSILASVYRNKIDISRRDYSKVRERVIANIKLLEAGTHVEFVCSSLMDQLMQCLVVCGDDKRALPLLESLYNKSDDKALDMKIQIVSGLSRLYSLKGQYENANRVLRPYVFSNTFAHQQKALMTRDYALNSLSLQDFGEMKKIWRAIAEYKNAQAYNTSGIDQLESVSSTLRIKQALAEGKMNEAKRLLREVLIGQGSKSHFWLVDWFSEFREFKALVKRQDYIKELEPVVETRMMNLMREDSANLSDHLAMLFDNVRFYAGLDFAEKLALAEISAARKSGQPEKIILANVHLGDVYTERDEGLKRSAALYLPAAKLSVLPPGRESVMYRVLAVYICNRDFDAACKYLDFIQANTLSESRRIAIQVVKRSVAILSGDKELEQRYCTELLLLTQKYPLDNFLAEMRQVSTNLGQETNYSEQLSDLSEKVKSISNNGALAFDYLVYYAECRSLIKGREALTHGQLLDHRKSSLEVLDKLYGLYVKDKLVLQEGSAADKEYANATRLQRFDRDAESRSKAQIALSKMNIRDRVPPGAFESKVFYLMFKVEADKESSRGQDLCKKAYELSSYSHDLSPSIEYLLRSSSKDGTKALQAIELALNDGSSFGVMRSALLTIAGDVSSNLKQRKSAKQYYEGAFVEDLIYDELQSEITLLYRYAKQSQQAWIEKQYELAEKNSRVCMNILMRMGSPDTDTWRAIIKLHMDNLRSLGKDDEAKELAKKYLTK